MWAPAPGNTPDACDTDLVAVALDVVVAGFRLHVNCRTTRQIEAIDMFSRGPGVSVVPEAKKVAAGCILAQARREPR